jgi:hypothetical protein
MRELARLTMRPPVTQIRPRGAVVADVAGESQTLFVPPEIYQHILTIDRSAELRVSASPEPPAMTRNGTLVMSKVSPGDPDVTGILVSALCELASEPKRPASPPPLPVEPRRSEPPPLPPPAPPAEPAIAVPPVAIATPELAPARPWQDIAWHAAPPVSVGGATVPTVRRPRKKRSIALAQVLVFLVVGCAVTGLGTLAYLRGWVRADVRIGALPATSRTAVR